MGTGLPGPAEGTDRWDNCTMPTPLLARCRVVAPVPTDTSESHAVSERTSLHRPGGDSTTCSEVAIRGSGHQRTLVIETTEALRAIQDILLFTDIPTNERVQMVQAIQEAHPLLRERAERVLNRLGKQRNGPRYEILYSLCPLVDFVHKCTTKLDTLDVPQLTKRLILAPRLSTFLQSVDPARMTTGL